MMSSRAYGAIDLTNLALALVVTAVGSMLWGVDGGLASGVGGLLACLNLWVIRRLARRAVRRAVAGDTTQASWLVAAMGLKMLVLFAMVWVALRVLNLSLIPFAIGISILPISLVFTGLLLGSTAGEEGRA
jgi:hypothetical protein